MSTCYQDKSSATGRPIEPGVADMGRGSRSRDDGTDSDFVDCLKKISSRHLAGDEIPMTKLEVKHSVDRGVRRRKGPDDRWCLMKQNMER
jgi:hypothetical protein